MGHGFPTSGLRSDELKRILVFRIGQIGDTIVALPVFWALRSTFPSARLWLLTNQERDSTHVNPCHVLPDEGLINDVLSYPSDGGVSAWTLLQLLRKLRKGRFDALVYLAPRQRTRFQVLRDLAFFRLAGISRFLAHRGFAPVPSAGAEGRLPTTQHEADHLLERLSLSGVQVPPPGNGCMDLCLGEEELARARTWLDQRAHGWRASGRRLVAIGPGSKWPSKIWPEERYAELGECIIREINAFLIVCGGPEDRDLAMRLVKRARVLPGASRVARPMICTISVRLAR